MKKANERKAEAKFFLRIIGMSHAMAEATAQGLQINCLFQLPLIQKEMWMEGCPCPQKSRHWKGVLAFQDKYFKSKNSESFVSCYNELLHAGLMKQLFAPLSRSIGHDIRSIPIRSSGFFRNAKSPELQRNLVPIFTKRKTENLPTAETLPPATFHVPNQNNSIKQSITLISVLECKETTEIDAIVEEHEDPKVDQGSKEILDFEPTSFATLSTCLPNNN